MRAVTWAIVVCAALAAASVFLPAVELRAGGRAIGHRTSLSLYQAQRDRAFARALLARYQGSAGARLGGAAVAALSPRVGGRLGDDLGDARDAMDALDGVRAEDARAASTALVAVTWGLLAVLGLVAALGLGAAVQGPLRARRAALVAALAVLAAAAMVALWLGVRWVVAAANDELGRAALGVGPAPALGAAASAAAALLALASATIGRRAAAGAG